MILQNKKDSTTDGQKNRRIMETNYTNVIKKLKKKKNGYELSELEKLKPDELVYLMMINTSVNETMNIIRKRSMPETPNGSPNGSPGVSPKGPQKNNIARK
jgi:hypothetical protein